MRLDIRLGFLIWILLATSLGLSIQPQTGQAAEVLQEKQSRKMFLIVVGVSKFSDSFWPTLQWAESDARSFASKVGTETQFQKITHLLINEDATSSKLREKLAIIERSAGKDDIVLLYISSHGTLRMSAANRPEPVVVLHNTFHDAMPRSSFPHTELREWLANLKPRHKALVLATCHSGAGKSKFTEDVVAFKKGEKGTTLRPFDSVSEGSLILAASARNETALESDELKSDVYSHFLLQGLEAADRNNDGVVSLLEAHDYARIRTYAFTKGRQRPTVEVEMIGDADFPLKGRQKQTGLPILEAYSSKYEGYFVGLEKGEKVELPLALPLQEGRNEVRLYQPNQDEPRRFVLNATPGEKISLEQLVAPPPYFLGLYSDYQRPFDSRFNKLTGKTGYYAYRIQAGSVVGLFDLSFGYTLNQELSSRARPNLTAKLQTGGFNLQVGGRWNAARQWTLRPSLELTYASNQLTFQDSSSGEAQSSRSRVLGYGLRLETLFLPTKTLPLTLSANVTRHFERHRFEPFGSLSLDSAVYGLGVNWNFGQRSREL